MPWNVIAETAELHEQFDKCLKLGTHEDSTDRFTFAEKIRCDIEVWRRTNFVEEFVDHPEERQNDVLHTVAESTAVMSLSPILLALRVRRPKIVRVVGPVDDASVLLLKELDEQMLRSTKKD